MASPPSILVVDDERDICQNLADILQEFGFEVETALDGESAIEMIRRRRFDVALLDLKMPVMDGLALYKAIREERPSIVSMIVTAYANAQTNREALQAGVWQVISKPVDLKQLLALVDDAVKQPILMVVDDDIDLCKSLWDILRDHGYRVCTALTDQEAIRRLGESQFQVVLVDLKLAPGDGRNVLEALRRQAPETKAILITGHPTELENSFQSSVAPDAVCLKPFDMVQLLETINRLVQDRSH